MRRLGFSVAGLVLFALPFLSVNVGGGHHAPNEPHADHEPQHGGLLLMIGDYHLEVVDGDGTLEVYTSDARRRPLTPVSGHVVFDASPPRVLTWQAHRLIAPAVPSWKTADVEVTLADGPVLAITVPRDPRRG